MREELCVAAIDHEIREIKLTNSITNNRFYN